MMLDKTQAILSQPVQLTPAGLDREQTLERQRNFFQSHQTLDVDFRVEKLKRLQKALVQEESSILEALQVDLGKAPFEAYATELGFVLEELRYTLNHIRQWTQPKKVATPLVHFPSSSWIYPEPLGVVLIISPWNYPIQLTFAPLIAAIAAGNCVVIKPSRHVPQSALAIEKVLHLSFEPEHVSLIPGGEETNHWLLEQRFDHIFFTGSTSVGRTVMAAAAKNLTPVTLELGGKSPCIVDRSAHIELAARRIIWGKCINAGQTCVAPDYLLVDKAVKATLVDRMQYYIRQFYGDNPLTNPEYPKIINERQFERLCKLMEGTHILSGGRVDASTRKFEPTLIDQVTLKDPIMQEEIFGPLLPIMEFGQREEALGIINQLEKPLSFYLFTRDKGFERQVLSTVPFGGGCVNDTLIHLANPRLPFGGIGNSGFGSYHGIDGFESFSHKKSILKKSDRIDILLRNPPFGNRLKLLRWLLK